MSIVSYEVGPRTESKSREVGHTPSQTSFWPASEGLRRTDGAWGGRPPSEGVGRRRRAGQTFHHPGVGERPGKNMLLLKRSLCFFYRHCPGKRAEAAMRGRYLGPAALIGPHGAIWWKSILVCHCTLARSHARRSGSHGRGRKKTFGSGSREGTGKRRGLDLPAWAPATSRSSDPPTKGTRRAVTQ